MQIFVANLSHQRIKGEEGGSRHSRTLGTTFMDIMGVTPN